MDALAAGDPDRIGGYWLAGRLGTGGQGVVYEAYDAAGGRYALKVLRAGADGEQRRRFDKEIAAARRVASFCTARIIDAAPAAAPPYIVSEYVEGVDLRRAGRLYTGDDLHRLATAVAAALTAIHEAGVVHRDLKPDNILLGPDGPRVIDFGIARTEEMSLTAGGYVAGTPTYMAPEVLTGGRAGEAADVFAWGGVMVFAATGEDPFRADTLGAVMHRVLSHDPDLGALPPGVRPLVAAALSKEPENRPSARELLLALAGGGVPDRFDGLRPAHAADPALGVLAEDAYALLTPEERDLVPELLLRLVAIGPDGLETVRPAATADLLPDRPGARRRILTVFGYMLTERDGEVVITRPAVLRAWPRLRQWVAADRDGLPLLAELSQAARIWETHGRREVDLLQGSRLETALGWAATGRRHVSLTPPERAFLTEAGRLTRRRGNRRRLLTVILAALLALSLTGGFAAVYQGAQVSGQRDQVAAERDRARGREIARVAADLRTTDPVRAMLLSVAAHRLAPGVESRTALNSALLQREVTAFRPPPVPGVVTQAVSGDGRTLAAISESGVRVYDVATGRQTATWTSPRLAGGAAGAELSRTGRLLAVVIFQSIVVWETRTGRLVGVKPMEGDNPSGIAPAFDDHDSLLAIGSTGPPYMIWDVEHDRSIPLPEEQGAFAVAPSGEIAATVHGEGVVSVWRMPGFRQDSRFPTGCGDSISSVGFSPDSRLLICGGERVELWDTATGLLVARIANNEENPWPRESPQEDANAPTAVRLNTDATLAAGFLGSTIRVWDVRRSRPILEYRAHGLVSDLWLDPDGGFLRYLLDGDVVTLDLRPAIPARRVGEDASTEEISPDGRWLAVEPPGGASRLELWDIPADRLAGAIPVSAGTTVDVTFDPSGRTVAVSHISETVDVYDAATQRRLWSYRHPDGLISTSEAFTGDGRTYAAVYSQNSQRQVDFWLHEWDARSGRPIRVVKLDLSVFDFALMPGGQELASATGRFVGTTTGKPAGLGYGTASAIITDRAGRWLALDRNQSVALWDVRNAMILTPDLRFPGQVEAMAFSPGGDVLATLSGNVLYLWDVATRRSIGKIGVDEGSDYLAEHLAFTSDGKRVRAATAGGFVYELPVEPALVADAVCARAGRTLTREEWRAHLGGIPYRDVCPALPVRR
ncbi:hypothetical protein Misp01_03670 [Microtetraspora sp. NBRC 13810]|uniref:serine/threonine-protein kinase n=1 Tax=Microtetraspora sp. NBRC 13810 TaxID=3030990 RepID=UPI0024A5976B|nr:serine/threonine-protein kinase [Microtetraspora sp. NBRC 13810]GLW05237.1 hypothetical protein Misp01_03670 [Microtetraspora sp. NBRC 13810]